MLPGRFLLAALVATLSCAGQSAAPPPPACPEQPAAAAPPAATASAAHRAIPYDLPRAGEIAPLPAPDLPGAGASATPMTALFVVTITRDGALSVNGKAIADGDLARLARDAHARDADVRAIIHADRAVSWGMVVSAIDRIKQAGIAKLAFGVSPVPATPSSASSSGPAPAAAASPMPADCEDICSVGVRCSLGHVKGRDACEAWCKSEADMGTYACIALQAQDCAKMTACWRKERAARPARQKAEEGSMGRPPKR